MKDSKGYIYTIILGVCLMGCLLLIGKMLLSSSAPLHTPGIQQNSASMEQEDSYFQLSESTLEGLIKDNTGNIPISDVDVSITSDSVIQFDLSIKRDDLKEEFLSAPGLSSFSDMLAILPEDVCLHCNVMVSSAGSGEIAVSPQDVTILDHKLPQNAIVDGIFSQISLKLNEILKENNIEVSNIICEDGYLKIKK